MTRPIEPPRPEARRLEALITKWRASAVERVRTVACELAERACADELEALLAALTEGPTPQEKPICQLCGGDGLWNRDGVLQVCRCRLQNATPPAEDDDERLLDDAVSFLRHVEWTDRASEEGASNLAYQLEQLAARLAGEPASEPRQEP